MSKYELRGRKHIMINQIIFCWNCPCKCGIIVNFSGSLIYNNIDVNVWFCLSQTSLLQGLYQGVACVFILSFSHNSWKVLLSNSPPLSVKTFFGAPNIATQFLRNGFATRLLFVISDAVLNLENSSTAWRYHRFGFNSWKSSDSVSLKESDFVKATTGFEGGFQNFWQVLHASITLFIICFKSFDIKFALVNNFFMFSFDAWPNCLWIFVIYLNFYLSEILFSNIRIISLYGLCTWNCGIIFMQWWPLVEKWRSTSLPKSVALSLFMSRIVSHFFNEVLLKSNGMFSFTISTSISQCFPAI